jgi:hypothetical protein
MRTTDDILKELEQRAVAGVDVRQQISSHKALARLRADLAEAEKGDDPMLVAALVSQIHVHRGLVDEDVDERIVEQPKKDSTKLLRSDEQTKG